MLARIIIVLPVLLIAGLLIAPGIVGRNLPPLEELLRLIGHEAIGDIEHFRQRGWFTTQFDLPIRFVAQPDVVSHLQGRFWHGPLLFDNGLRAGWARGEMALHASDGEMTPGRARGGLTFRVGFNRDLTIRADVRPIQNDRVDFDGLAVVLTQRGSKLGVQLAAPDLTLTTPSGRLSVGGFKARGGSDDIAEGHRWLDVEWQVDSVMINRPGKEQVEWRDIQFVAQADATSANDSAVAMAFDLKEATVGATVVRGLSLRSRIEDLANAPLVAEGRRYRNQFRAGALRDPDTGLPLAVDFSSAVGQAFASGITWRLERLWMVFDDDPVELSGYLRIPAGALSIGDADTLSSMLSVARVSEGQFQVYVGEAIAKAMSRAYVIPTVVEHVAQNGRDRSAAEIAEMIEDTAEATLVEYVADGKFVADGVGYRSQLTLKDGTLAGNGVTIVELVDPEVTSAGESHAAAAGGTR